MNENLFLQQLTSLENGESTKEFRVVVTSTASDKNQNEVFFVSIFRTRKGMFKLQWTKKMGGDPELPTLKRETADKLIEALRNRSTFLTSGPGTSTDGMARPEMVLEMIRVLGRNEILIELA